MQTLKLLDWCVSYFRHGDHGKQARLAEQLDRQCTHIRERLEDGS